MLIGCPTGTRHGPGVQRGEDVQNGPAAAEMSLGVYSYHRGPNEKGKVPPSGHCLNCQVSYCWEWPSACLLPSILLCTVHGSDTNVLLVGLWESLHGYRWDQHRRSPCVLHLGAVCRQEFQCRCHRWKSKGPLPLSVSMAIFIRKNLSVLFVWMSCFRCALLFISLCKRNKN